MVNDNKVSNKNANRKKQLENSSRHILVDPFSNFWPLLLPDDAAVLDKELERCLPLAKKHRGFLPRKKLSAIYKEKSKEKRKLLWKEKIVAGVSEEELEQAKENRKYFLLGVNGITKGIEKSRVACCVIAGDVSTKLFANHVVTMSARKRIPVVILPALRQLTNVNLGIRCSIIALKKEVSENKENKFHKLYETIEKLAEKFDIPQHLEVNTDHEKMESNVQPDKKSPVKKFDIPQHLKVKTDHEKMESNAQPDKKLTVNVDKVQEVEKKEEIPFEYLYRIGSTKQRTYEPPKYEEHRASKMEFILLSGDDEYVTRQYINRTVEESDGRDDEEEDDDDDDDDDSEDEHFAELGDDDDDPMFFVDTKRSHKPIAKTPVICKKRKKASINLEPLVVKRVKGNPKKVKKKKKKM